MFTQLACHDGAQDIAEKGLKHFLACGGGNSVGIRSGSHTEEVLQALVGMLVVQR
jgi:hypothetical protein